ncbi:IMP cyclohydrolase [Candidatus Woesearchaeota archaeon]|nr:IMP cyclohydrolase [Candidatus Woesearchaeota archaeon]
MDRRLQKDYTTRMEEHFPDSMTITLGDKVLRFEKATWKVPDSDGTLVESGLRYGENPGQQAAMYRLLNGNLIIGDVETIQPGRWLASDAELLQSGKHPGKINITDADNAMNILRYFSGEPVVAIMKHNNPCGVAIGTSLVDAYVKADCADRLAAFGGAIALNLPVDMATAEAIASRYAEVVVAPEYEGGVMSVLGTKKNLRVMRISNMSALKDWVGVPVLDFKSLIDGGLIVQTSYVPQARTLEDIKALPLGYHQRKGELFKVQREPTENEFRDMLFGWLVESGVSSNSVIYVKDGVTVGIGTGEQDRVGAAEIARDKAYSKLTDIMVYEALGLSYNELLYRVKTRYASPKDLKTLKEIKWTVQDVHGGLVGAIMVSDAFFPFRDGIDVGLEEGVTAVIQPGGSVNDWQVIEACNEKNATMVFTGQRSFKH